MGTRTMPQVHYQLHDEPPAGHHMRLVSAFDLLFEEVLRMRSVIGCVHHHVAPTESTHTEGRE